MVGVSLASMRVSDLQSANILVRSNWDVGGDQELNPKNSKNKMSCDSGHIV